MISGHIDGDIAIWTVLQQTGVESDKIHIELATHHDAAHSSSVIGIHTIRLPEQTSGLLSPLLLVSTGQDGMLKVWIVLGNQGARGNKPRKEINPSSLITTQSQDGSHSRFERPLQLQMAAFAPLHSTKSFAGSHGHIVTCTTTVTCQNEKTIVICGTDDGLLCSALIECEVESGSERNRNQVSASHVKVEVSPALRLHTRRVTALAEIYESPLNECIIESNRIHSSVEHTERFIVSAALDHNIGVWRVYPEFSALLLVCLGFPITALVTLPETKDNHPTEQAKCGLHLFAFCGQKVLSVR